MGDLVQLHLAINVTSLVEPTEPSSVWEKFQLHLTSTCLLELLVADYNRESNISIFICHLWFFVLIWFRCFGKVFDEERNKNKYGSSQDFTTIQLSQKEIGMMKFLALTSYLLARIKLTLISYFAIPSCFQKVNFEVFY